MALAATAVAAPAAAAYPESPVTMIVPFPDGGPTDVLARILAQHLGEMWEQPVVVDYKPGASTMLGTAAVAKAAPDGYTIGVVTPAFVINPGLQPKLLYENDDLTAITQLIRVPLSIAANADAPFNTLSEMMAYAKEHPNEVTYASPGTGGTSHLAGEMLARLADVKLSHIPYKGSAPAHTDVIGGRVMVMIDPLFSLTPHIESKRLKLIATTGAERSEVFPDHQAVSEIYPDFEVQALIGLVAPTGTPDAVIQKIQQDAAKVLAMPEVRKRAQDLGMEVVASTPTDFADRIKTEQAQWAKVIKDANIKIGE